MGRRLDGYRHSRSNGETKLNIEANKQAREEAEAAFQFNVETAESLPVLLHERYWVVLGALIAEKMGAVAPEEPSYRMSEEEAKRFENTPMPWGKHSGERVGNVDLAYLLWVAEKRDDFVDEVRRYVRSERAQSEQTDPVDESAPF